MSFLALLAAAALAAAPIGRMGPTGPVQTWPGAFGSFFQTAGEGVPGSGQILRNLSRMDLTSEAGGRTLVPVTKALAAMGYTPQAFAQLDYTTQKIIAGLAAADAARTLTADAKMMIAASQAEQPLLDELIRAEQELGDVWDFHSIYVPREVLLQAKDAQDRAARKLEALRQSGLMTRIEATRSALELSADDSDLPVSAFTPAEAAALGLIDDLREEHNKGSAKLKARKLARLTLKHKDNERLRLLVIRQLIKDARRRFPSRDHWAEEHAERVALQLVKLAKDAPEPAQAAAVQGLLEGWATGENLHGHRAVDAAMIIAARSPHLSVKSLAVGWAMKHPGLEKLIEPVVLSAGGLDKLAVPDVPAPRRLRTQGEKHTGFLDKIEAGVAQHPIGAFFAAFWTALAAMTAMNLGLTLLSAGVFAAMALRVAAHGLFKHHPWGVFMQIGLLGHFMEQAAAHAHWDGITFVAFALSAAVWSWVGVASLKAHKPGWGWLVNLGLLTAALHFLLGVDWSRMFTYTIRLSGN